MWVSSIIQLFQEEGTKLNYNIIKCMWNHAIYRDKRVTIYKREILRSFFHSILTWAFNGDSSTYNGEGTIIYTPIYFETKIINNKCISTNI